MSLPVLELSFFAGQCILTLRSPTEEISIENHWINGRFTELVNCVDLLLEGVESTSCRWQGPVHEGHFVDLVADPRGGISIAVHAFRYPDGGAGTFSEIWSAERGEVVFSTHLPLVDFILAFAAALRRTRSTSVDAGGMIVDYPRPFPGSIFERIEIRASRMGYFPAPLFEIENPPPAPE